MSLASYRAAPPRTVIVASTVLGERAIGYFFAGRWPRKSAVDVRAGKAFQQKFQPVG